LQHGAEVSFILTPKNQTSAQKQLKRLTASIDYRTNPFSHRQSF